MPERFIMKIKIGLSVIEYRPPPLSLICKKKLTQKIHIHHPADLGPVHLSLPLSAANSFVLFRAEDLNQMNNNDTM